MKETGPVYEIQSTPKGRATIQPNSSPNDMPDPMGERTPDWYLQNVRYVITYYNTYTPNINYPYSGQAVKTNGLQNTNGPTPDTFYQPPVDKMLLELAYFTGDQPNMNFSWLAKDVSNNNATAFWTTGKRMRTIFDKMIGAALGTLTGLKFGANPLSSDIKSEREKKVQIEMVKFLMRQVLEEVMKGDLQMPPSADDFANLEDIKKWGETSIKEKIADIYLNIANNEWLANYWIEVALELFKNAIINGHSGAVEQIFENGQMLNLIHKPYNTIFDNREDGDFNRNARFGGVIVSKSVPGAIATYREFNEEQREALRRISSNKEAVKELNRNSNLPWWSGAAVQDDNYKDTALNICRCYWICPELVDGVPVNELYTATVIGNKYMVRYGKMSNVIRDTHMPFQVQLPLKMWFPGMTGGKLNSLVSRVMDIQDEIDLYRFKIREQVAKAKGKVFYVDGDIGTQTTKGIIEDLSTLGLTHIPSSGLTNDTNRQIIKMIDWTMGADIKEYIALMERANAEMDSFLGQTKVTLGEQDKYMGQESYQANAEAAASGSAVLYKDFLRFLAICLRSSVNMKKNLYVDGQLKEEAETVIGKKGVELLQEFGRLDAEDFLIYIVLNDNLDDTMRERLFEIAKAYANSPTDGLGWVDLMELLKAKTSTELMEKATARSKEIKAENKQDQMMQMKNNQAISKQQSDDELKQLMLIESGKNDRNLKQFEGKIVKILADHGILPNGQTAAEPTQNGQTPVQPAPGSEPPAQPNQPNQP